MMWSLENEEESQRIHTGRLEKRKEIEESGTQAVPCDCYLFLHFMGVSFIHRGGGALHTGREAS